MPMIRYVTTISSRQNNKIKRKSTGFLYMKMARMISTTMTMTGFYLAKEAILTEVLLMKVMKSIETPFENYIMIISHS